MCGAPPPASGAVCPACGEPLVGTLRPPRARASRWRYAGAALLAGWSGSALSTAVTTVVWEAQETAAGSVRVSGLAVLGDLPGMLLLMPVGFVVFTFLPPGWLFWLGFAAAVRFKSHGPLAFCALGGVLFGCYWPRFYIGMTGI